MKVSLRWIADYLAIDWKLLDVAKLVEHFNTKVAEIEAYSQVKLPLEPFFMALSGACDTDTIQVDVPELKKYFTLPLRQQILENQWYVIKKHADGYQWATYSDFGLDKEGLLPSVVCTQEAAKGAWRKQIELEDYILEVDNKSITHRPDLWGHYGLARECALLLEVSLKELPIANCKVIEHNTSFKATTSFPISLAVKTEQCSHFSALSVSGVHDVLPIDLFRAIRLMRVGQRSIDGIVDMTNYVMLDCGQPLHAFDAEKIDTKKIEPRQAQVDEELLLLDGTSIALSDKDIVISDGKKPLALAGIKGGKDSGVTESTSHLLVEAATFDAATIRLSAARHGIRTEASARFEKTLDPLATITALQRFLFLLRESSSTVQGETIISLGVIAQPLVISVEHQFLEKRLGVTLASVWVIDLLEKLGFAVVVDGTTYQITVPSYRATKDVRQKEDIVEEVGRFYGYANIPLVLPHARGAEEIAYNYAKEESIKQFLYSVAHMREVRNYAFFDNYFLQKINWKLENPVILENPLSEQRTVLATSLIPGLLYNIEQNSAAHDTLRFFEWARTWQVVQGAPNGVQEKQVLSGIFYQRKGIVDFYLVKAYLEQLFLELDIPIVWRKKEDASQWASTYQAADILCEGKVIGHVAKIKRFIMTSFDGADACAFEIDVHTLLTYEQPEKKFVALPKYQASVFDISVLVSQDMQFADLKDAVEKADIRIFSVTLQDVFIKPEWQDKKSLTIRYYARDENQTLQKKDLEVIQNSVKNSVESYGAEVR